MWLPSFGLLLNVLTNFMFFLNPAVGGAVSKTPGIDRMPFLSTWLIIDVALGVRE